VSSFGESHQEQFSNASANVEHALLLYNLVWSRQIKEYVPPAPESLNAEVPTNMSLDQLKAEGEAKRGTLETWCRTAYGEVSRGQAKHWVKLIQGGLAEQINVPIAT
jgi:hypothetical protein